MANTAFNTRKLLSHSAIYAIGNISRHLVAFVMLPVYTSYLTPSDYGVVGLITVAMSVFEALFGAKMSQALPKFFHDQSDARGRHAVISTAFLVTGLISTLTVVALFLARGALSQVLFASREFALVVGICGVQIFTQALEYYALTYLRLCDRPVTFVVVSLAKLATQLTLNVALVVYLDLGILGVAVSGALSSATFAVGLTLWTLRRTGVAFDRRLARRMLAFSWPLWLLGLASLYIEYASRYFIRLFASLDSLGLYELATKFAAILLLLVWTPFFQYWQTEQFAVLRQRDPQRVFGGVFLAVGALLVVAGLGISIFADSAIRLMASPQFHPAAAAVPLLVLAVIFYCLAEFASGAFLARGQTRWLSWNRYFLAALATPLYAGLTPLLGFVGAALAGALTQCVYLVTVQIALRREVGLRLPVAPLAQMLVVAAGVYALSNHALVIHGVWLETLARLVAVLLALAAFALILWRCEVSREGLRAIVDTLPGRGGVASPSAP